MVKYENECVQCASPGYPCKGNSCSNKKVPHWYCDKCEWEFEPNQLYQYQGQELCVDCLVENFEVVRSD